MEKIRVGLLGAGFIANRHADVLMGFDDVHVVGVCDPDLDRAGRLAQRVGGRAFADHDELLDRAQPDALFICVPPFAHGEPEWAAIERGLPFLVEKPLGTDIAGAEAVNAAVAERQAITAVGYHWRYLDIFEHAAELVAGHPARLALGYWLDATPPPRWWSRQQLSGGQTIEQTTHVLDLARTLVGEVTRVYGASARTPRSGFADADVGDVSTATVHFASGALGSISSTCLLDWRHRVGIHLFGEGMAIELSEFDIVVDVGRGKRPRNAQGDPVLRQDRAFLDAVSGGADRIRVPYAEALRTHRLACLVARSAAEGRPLDLDGGSAGA